MAELHVTVNAGLSDEEEAVLEDGLGPEDVGLSSPDSESCGTSKDQSVGAPICRQMSYGALPGTRIWPASTVMKFEELSEAQRRQILFPPVTFDFLRDDIRKNLIDLIDFKLLHEEKMPLNHDPVGDSKSERRQPTANLGTSNPLMCKVSGPDNQLEAQVNAGRVYPFNSPSDVAGSSSTDELPNNLRCVASNREWSSSNDAVEVLNGREGAGTADVGAGVGAKKLDSDGRARLESFVLIHNVAKRHNLGTLARSSTAFGVSELILVGRKDFNAFGSHGATLHLQFRHFHTLGKAAQYLKAKHVAICGVEITEGAARVNSHPFTGSTAFVLGNEGTGLSEKEMEICDFFVYIPQCGPGTASLNVTVAASIVLHHFAVWAGFPERQREGHKYIVAERPIRRGPRNMCPDSPEQVAEQRRQKAETPASEDWLLYEALDDTAEDDGFEVQESAAIEFPNEGTSQTGLSSLTNLFD